MRRILLTLCLLAAPLGACSAAPNSPHATWEHTQGGTLDAAPERARATAALHRLVPDSAALSIHILNAPDPVAFSFPDGSIYLSQSLVQLLPDDPLAAAIAHELGHLLHDRHLPPPFSLRGIDLTPPAPTSTPDLTAPPTPSLSTSSAPTRSPSPPSPPPSSKSPITPAKPPTTPP